MVDLEPIEIGNVEILAPPGVEFRRRRCSPEARTFMHNVLRTLEYQTTKEQPHPSLEVPINSFNRLGITGKDNIIDALLACPESTYVKPEVVDDKVKLTKVLQPDARPVKHYSPKKYSQDEEEN